MNLKSKFKPRAEAGLLSQLVQSAWQDYQNRIASAERQAEVAEIVACYFEKLIPTNDFEVLKKYNCIAYHDHCNVRVYDAETEDPAKYRETFGIQLLRKVPVLGTGGYGYPSLVMCEPWRGDTKALELDGYFLSLLTARKQYKKEYKASTNWPAEYGKEHGQYPTWGEIAEKFPILGDWLRKSEQENRL
jgi:hypothetical protein